jgi:hypothetical protein
MVAAPEKLHGSLVLSALLSDQGDWVEQQRALYCALLSIAYESIDERASLSRFGGIWAEA